MLFLLYRSGPEIFILYLQLRPSYDILDSVLFSGAAGKMELQRPSDVISSVNKDA